jgi:hypothetical protein
MVFLALERRSLMKGIFLASLLGAVVLGGAGIAADQADKPGMTADLVDAEKNGARGAATVVVKVTGVTLTDPASANELPKAGQAHLHYQIDDGPVVATTSPKLSYHGLRAGDHKIVVMLAANDHAPLGPQQTLTVHVTKAASN